jgi:predicted acylesterase/phospholipase RssA
VCRNLDPGISDAERERAANLLKDTPLFGKFSRRLLIDVVERSVAGRLRAGPNLVGTFISEETLPKGITGEIATPGQILAIVVLKGTLIARPKSGAGASPLEVPLAPPGPSVPFAIELHPGVHMRGTGPFTDPRVDLGDLALEASKNGEVDVLVVSSGLVEAPAAAWGIDLEAIHIHALSATVASSQRPDLIWIAATTGSKATVEALTHVLAGKIATDFPSDPVMLVILGPSPSLLQWKNGRFEVVHPKGMTTLGVDVLFDVVGAKSRARIFVLNPDDTLKRPSSLGDVRFDRVVYLTDDIPPQVPDHVRDILRETLTSSASPAKAHLSSFLPSILRNTENTSCAKLGQFKFGQLQRRGVKSKSSQEQASDAFMCCVQDTTFVPFGFAHLEDTWSKWQADGGTAQPDSFLAVAIGSGAISGNTLGHWGRAVTNRRVGIACSGGGASAYRIGPLLERIEQHGIPVDVYAGLSGSALIGSFYSLSGMSGFNFARRLGPFFQLTLPLVTLWTQPWEWVMDFFLDGARVEDLGIRFAAVAAALPDSGRPRVTVVVNGTLGEAVRVSGSLPPSFAPSDKNGVRYTDGGAGTAVPARVARDCGADVVLACNVIPGPALGNPFSVIPLLGWLVRKTPFVGRMVDNYTWYAFLMQETSRAFGESADVFVEFEEQDFPLFESTAFIAADCIIAKAEQQNDYLNEKVGDLLKAWQVL